MKLDEFLVNSIEEKVVSESVEFRNGRYFPKTMKGKPIGSKQGYSTMKEAVRAFYSEVLTTFKYLNPERQEMLVNNYIKKMT